MSGGYGWVWEGLGGSGRLQKVLGGSEGSRMVQKGLRGSRREAPGGELNIQVCYVGEKNIISSFHFVKLTPWIEVTLDKCLLEKLFLGQKSTLENVSLDNRPLVNCLRTHNVPHWYRGAFIKKTETGWGCNGPSSAQAGIGLQFNSLSRPTFPFTPF